MANFTVDYSGDLHCLLTHARSGSKVETDAPPDNNGKGERFSPTDLVCAALGACMIERHITLDRAMWGSDQAASVEPQGLMKLVRDTRTIESGLGDGVKKVTDDEIPIMKKLRRVG